MFIIELTYKVPLEEIDAHMKAHVAYLNNIISQKILLFQAEKFRGKVE